MTLKIMYIDDDNLCLDIFEKILQNIIANISLITFFWFFVNSKCSFSLNGVRKFFFSSNVCFFITFLAFIFLTARAAWYIKNSPSISLFFADSISSVFSGKCMFLMDRLISQRFSFLNIYSGTNSLKSFSSSSRALWIVVLNHF